MYNLNSLEDIMRSPTIEEVNESVEDWNDELRSMKFGRLHKKNSKRKKEI